MQKQGSQFIVVFLAPALFLYTAFVAVPAVRALAYSLEHWNGLTPPRWAGLDNFAALFESGGLFLRALSNNLILLLGAGSIITLLSLFFASLLHRRIRGAALFRVTFFFPNVIASVAVALLWVLLYSTTEFGLVNALLAKIQTALHALGLASPNIVFPFPFLASNHLIFSLIPMLVWAATGFYMLLYLAAMQSIPETYYEAARLDGASPCQQFRHITLPLIREVLVIGVVFLLITTLKIFDPIWVMENQRPTSDSHVLATLVYEKAFTEYNIGYGATVAVMLFLFVFCATLVSLRLRQSERMEY